MKKETEKKLKHLRTRSIVPAIVFFVLAIIVSFILINILTTFFMGNAVSNRVAETHRRNSDLIQELEENVSGGTSYEEALSVMQQSIYRPMGVRITDVNGNSLAGYGDEELDSAIIIDVDDLNFSIDLRVKNNQMVGAVNDDIVFDVEEIVNNIIHAYDLMDQGDYRGFLSSEVATFRCWVRDSLPGEEEIIYIRYEQSLYIMDCLQCAAVAMVTFLVVLILLNIIFFSSLSATLSQRQVLRMILKDTITGGMNELAFEQFAVKALSRFKKREYAVVDLTMTKYQNYCTLHGTLEGERMLTLMDQAIKRHLVEGECCARVAGASFEILLHSKDGEVGGAQMMERMDRMLVELPETMRSLVRRGEPELEGLGTMLFKAGLYVIDPVTDKESRQRRNKKEIDVDKYLIKAGIAKAGLGEEGGLMRYNHAMWEKEIWRQKVEDMMVPAMENEEFQVYIQPKYNPVTEKLMGGEALVRWISPSEGFISPGQFVPIFEENGFVTRLDDYMISHVAKLQSEWLKEGKEIVPISVNVSRLHFSQPDLAEHIRDLVDQYPLPHQYIEIELTESAFFDDKKALLSTVRRLQEYGFEVSMDDFGSGYSSLNSLKDLPLDVLKLDAEFFRGDDFDSRGKIVVSEAISLAKQLNMRIVAEGVEQKEHVDFLAQVNCDMIQGYYYAKPMPAKEYEERMQG